MNEQPKIRLELEVPAVQVQHHLESHNETIEQQVKEGVDQAIETLSTEGYLANAIKEKILTEIRNGYANKIWRWKLKDEVKEKFRQKIDNAVDNYSDKIIKEITRDLDESTNN